MANGTTPGRTRGRGARVLLARSTHRPAKKVPNAVAAAIRLTEEAAKEGLRLTDADIAFLDKCASGRAPRNAQACISAIKLKLDFTQPKPKQQVEHSGTITHAHLVAEAAK